MSEADRLAAQSLRDMEAAPGLMLHEEEPPAKFARTSPAGSRSTNRHIQTEQRRRDRINEGFQALRDLMPTQEKMDKASFLMAGVDYIRRLQDQMQQLLASGAISRLPEEVQWNVRVLLPRGQDLSGSRQARGAPSNPGAAPNLSPGVQAFLPLAAPSAPPPAPAAPAGAAAPGQDMAAQLQNMLAQAALMQQLQASQSVHSQLLQLLQLQLVQGSTPDQSGNQAATLLAQLTAQAQQTQQAGAAPGNALAGLNLSALLGAPLGVSAPTLSPAASQPLPMPAGCCGPSAAGGQDTNTPKARKGTKVRRHTTVSKLGQPSPPQDNRDGRPQLTDLM